MTDLLNEFQLEITFTFRWDTDLVDGENGEIERKEDCVY